MHVLRDYRNCPAACKGAAIAIGNFDGVHRGHQAVIAAAQAHARRLGAPAGVMAFEPHPRQFFQPDVPFFRLTSLPIKLELFAALGLDMAAVLRFDAALATLTAEEFVSQVLVQGLGLRHAVIGHDFHFGKGRGGNPQVLEALGRRHGFGVSVVEPVGADGTVFSSSQVRALLRAGEPRRAADILGYWWRFSGTVVGGAGRGKGLGFPTANIAVEPGMDLKHGIYAVRATLPGGRAHGAAYLGTRPTFGAGEAMIEVFLFDFEGDLYGQTIEIEVIAYLRGDAGFASTDELKAQMQADCERARALLAEIEADDPMRAYPLARALSR